MKKVGAKFLAAVLSVFMLFTMNGIGILANTVTSKDYNATDVDVVSKNLVTSDVYTDDTYTLTFEPGDDSTGTSYTVQVPQNKYIVFHDGYLYVYRTKMAANGDLAAGFDSYTAHKKLYAYKCDGKVQTGWSGLAETEGAKATAYKADTLYPITANTTITPVFDEGNTVTFVDDSNSVSGNTIQVPEGGQFYIYDGYRNKSGFQDSYYYRVYNAGGLLADYGELALTYDGYEVSGFSVGGIDYAFASDTLEIPVSGATELEVKWTEAVNITFTGIANEVTMQARAGQYVRYEDETFYLYNSKSEAKSSDYDSSYVGKQYVDEYVEDGTFIGWSYNDTSVESGDVIAVTGAMTFTGSYRDSGYVTLKGFEDDDTTEKFFVKYGNYLKLNWNWMEEYVKQSDGSYQQKHSTYVGRKDSDDYTLLYIVDQSGNKYPEGTYIEATEDLELTAVYGQNVTISVKTDSTDTEPVTGTFPVGSYLKLKGDCLYSYVKIGGTYVETDNYEYIWYSTEEGKTFNGFKDEDSTTYSATDYVPVSEGLTLTMQYTALSYTSVTVGLGESETGSSFGVSVPTGGTIAFDSSNSSGAYYYTKDAFGKYVNSLSYTQFTKEGYLITGWSDGTNTYSNNEAITVTEEMTITPVFTKSGASYIVNGISATDDTKTGTLNTVSGGVIVLSRYNEIFSYLTEQDYTDNNSYMDSVSVETPSDQYLAGYTIGTTEYLFDEDNEDTIVVAVADTTGTTTITPIYKEFLSKTVTIAGQDNTITVPEDGYLRIARFDEDYYYDSYYPWGESYSAFENLSVGSDTVIIKGFVVDDTKYLFEDTYSSITTGAITTDTVITQIAESYSVVTLTASDDIGQTINVPEGGYIRFDMDCGEYYSYYEDGEYYEYGTLSFSKEGYRLVGYTVQGTSYTAAASYDGYLTTKTITSEGGNTLEPVYKKKVTVSFAPGDGLLTEGGSVNPYVTATEGEYLYFRDGAVLVYESLADIYDGGHEGCVNYSEFTNSGYEISGWLYDYDTTTYSTGQIVEVGSSDMEFTAQWVSSSTYSVTLNDGTTGGDKLELTVPTQATQLQINRNTGYVLATDDDDTTLAQGYIDFENESNVITGFNKTYTYAPFDKWLYISLEDRTEDLTLSADWGARYKITVQDESGNLLNTAYATGDVYAAYENGDIELYKAEDAEYSEKTLRFGKEGYDVSSITYGTDNKALSSTRVKLSETTTFTVTFEESEITTVTLNGGTKASGTSYTIAAPVGGYIVFTETKVKSYYADDTLYQTKTVNYGVDKDVALLTGYAVGGSIVSWLQDECGIVDVTKNMTMTAQWADAVTVTVNYSNGEDSETDTLIAYKGTKISFWDYEVRSYNGSVNYDDYSNSLSDSKEFAYAVGDETYYTGDSLEVTGALTVNASAVSKKALTLSSTDGATTKTIYVSHTYPYIALAEDCVNLYTSVTDVDYNTVSCDYYDFAKTGREIAGWKAGDISYELEELIPMSGDLTITPDYKGSVEVTVNPGTDASGDSVTFTALKEQKLHVAVSYDAVENFKVYDENSDNIASGYFSREGYAITGWMVNDTELELSDYYPVTDSTAITITPIWTELKTVTLSDGVENGSTVTITVPDEGTISVAGNSVDSFRDANAEYDYAEKTFNFKNGTKYLSGWKVGSEQSYSIGETITVSDDMTVSAVWSDGYTLTYADYSYVVPQTGYFVVDTDGTITTYNKDGIEVRSYKKALRGNETDKVITSFEIGDNSYDVEEQVFLTGDSTISKVTSYYTYNFCGRDEDWDDDTCTFEVETVRSGYVIITYEDGELVVTSYTDNGKVIESYSRSVSKDGQTLSGVEINGTTYEVGEKIDGTSLDSCSLVWTSTSSTETITLTYVSAKAATCCKTGNREYWYYTDSDGTTHYYTDSAGANEVTKSSLTLSKSATNHASYGTSVKNKKAATYFDKGYTGDKVCNGCGKVISSGKTIAKKTLSKVNVKSLKAKKGKKMKVTWAKNKDATGYIVQYATNKKFKKAKSVTVKGAKKTSTTLKKLKAGKKYYVRVIAYKTGKNASKKKVTVKASAGKVKSAKTKKK
ncbi:MAG: fibronectin type III domain-containing protein [Eubacterium sp.]|nr:fibronectin type III domain-containing protein [Eubacterium sp.]